MSVYAVNTLCQRVVHDHELRKGLQEAPEETLRGVRPPLSDEEIELLLVGDVGRLSRMGANSFLLHQLGRWELFGLDLKSYGERIRTAWREERRAGMVLP